MPVQPAAASPSPSDRGAAWAAIASGAVGLAAFGYLIAFLVTRISGGTEAATVPLIRMHDAGLAVQSLLMIPLVLALGRAAEAGVAGSRRAWTGVGVAALVLVVLALGLIFLHVVPDDLYMIPLGGLAQWLIAENGRASGTLPRGVRRLGKVAGWGLLLVAVFPIAFTLFVDGDHLKGWTPFDYQAPAGTDTANAILHIMLVIGTFSGVLLYPIWTALAGLALVRGGRGVQPAAAPPLAAEPGIAS